MKKILLYIILVLSIFSFVSRINATGYAWSNNFSIPWIASSTGISWYGVNTSFYWQTSQSTFSQVVQYDGTTPSRYMESAVFGSNFKDTFFSWSSDIYLNYVGAGTPWTCNRTSWGIMLWVMDNGSWYSFYLQSFNQPSSQGCGGTDPELWSKIVVQTLPYNYSCWPDTTDTKNCIVMVKPVFYQDLSTALHWVYIAYADIAIYNADWTSAKWTRKYFDWTESTDTSSWFQSVLQWSQSYNGSLGSLILNSPSFWQLESTYNRLDPHWISFSPLASKFHYYRVNAPTDDDTKMRDFMVGSTGAELSVTTKTWFWYSTLSASVTGTGASGNPNGAFSICTSFLDVWCYIEWFYNGFSSTINSFTSFFSFDVSFTGNSNNCLSWSTSGFGSWITSISYFQKVANLFVLVIPLPPLEWSMICTFDWLQPMKYRRKYEWQITEMTITNIPDDYNGFDTILLLFFSLCAWTYLYHLTHKTHD